jgi:hypothetical protein
MFIMLAGLVLAFAGFIFFRKPGVPLWFHGPVWRASEYVTPAGELLWKAGSVLSLLGSAALVWSMLEAMS